MSDRQELIKDLQSVVDRLEAMPETVIQVQDEYKQKWELLKLTLQQMLKQNSVVLPSSNHEESKVKVEKDTRVKLIDYTLSMMEEMEREVK